MTTAERGGAEFEARQPSEAGLPEPESRGTLRIHDRVVEKVAGHAVTTIPDAAAAPRRVLGMTVSAARRPDDEAAKVTATVHGDSVTVAATVAVSWPSPIRQVVAQLGQRIRDDISLHTGLSVDRIDLDVVSLRLAEGQGRRVV
jgi:uncharacterized alkaline shock family protein YloU